jgi:hypothetical protein
MEMEVVVMTTAEPYVENREASLGVRLTSRAEVG